MLSAYPVQNKVVLLEVNNQPMRRYLSKILKQRCNTKKCDHFYINISLPGSKLLSWLLQCISSLKIRAKSTISIFKKLKSVTTCSNYAWRRIPRQKGYFLEIVQNFSLKQGQHLPPHFLRCDQNFSTSIFLC